MKRFTTYDRISDIFAVHNGFEKDEKFKINEMIGDLVLDVSTKNRIVGIEVLNAARFFRGMGITEEMLENMIDAELKVESNDGYIITIIIKSRDGVHPARIAVPTLTPLEISA